MASIVNTAAIEALTKAGIETVFSSENTYEQQYEKIFKVKKADKQVMYQWEVKGAGLPQEMGDGGDIQFSGMQQMFQYSVVVKTYGLGIMITEDAQVFNIYKEQFNPAAQSMKKNFLENRSILAANIFNFGFDSSPQYAVGDGKPLYSLEHPTFGGKYANTLSTPRALNQASLQAACIANGQMLTPQNFKYRNEVKLLYVPWELQYVAGIITGSQYEPGTPNNAINPMNKNPLSGKSSFPGGVLVDSFLTNPNNYFLINKEDEAFIFYEAHGVKTNVTTDPNNFNINCSGRERVGPGVFKIRATFGVKGA